MEAVLFGDPITVIKKYLPLREVFFLRCTCKGIAKKVSKDDIEERVEKLALGRLVLNTGIPESNWFELLSNKLVLFGRELTRSILKDDKLYARNYGRDIFEDISFAKVSIDPGWYPNLEKWSYRSVFWGSINSRPRTLEGTETMDVVRDYRSKSKKGHWRIQVFYKQGSDFINTIKEISYNTVFDVFDNYFTYVFGKRFFRFSNLYGLLSRRINFDLDLDKTAFNKFIGISNYWRIKGFRINYDLPIKKFLEMVKIFPKIHFKAMLTKRCNRYIEPIIIYKENGDESNNTHYNDTHYNDTHYNDKHYNDKPRIWLTEGLEKIKIEGLDQILDSIIRCNRDDDGTLKCLNCPINACYGFNIRHYHTRRLDVPAVLIINDGSPKFSGFE